MGKNGKNNCRQRKIIIDADHATPSLASQKYISQQEIIGFWVYLSLIICANYIKSDRSLIDFLMDFSGIEKSTI